MKKISKETTLKVIQICIVVTYNAWKSIEALVMDKKKKG